MNIRSLLVAFVVALSFGTPLPTNAAEVSFTGSVDLISIPGNPPQDEVPGLLALGDSISGSYIFESGFAPTSSSDFSGTGGPINVNYSNAITEISLRLNDQDYYGTRGSIALAWEPANPAIGSTEDLSRYSITGYLTEGPGIPSGSWHLFRFNLYMDPADTYSGISTIEPLSGDLLLQAAYGDFSVGLTGSGYIVQGPLSSISVETVPIPAAAWLFLSGLGVVSWIRRKDRVPGRFLSREG